MLIDWFTVAAQSLNFLLLVWLLKRYLYQPILDAIDARELRIANELADAAKKQQEASQERDDYKQKNVDFDLQRNDLLLKAKEAANSERQRLLNAAGVAADDLIAKRKLALQNEQQNFNEELSHLTRTQVFAIARKTLKDLSDKQLESAIVRVFIKQLHNLNDDAKSSFAESISKANDSVCIRSAFELPDAEREEIRQAVNACFSSDIRLNYATADQRIAGIELSAQGQLIAWTIASYLSALEKHIANSLTATMSSPSETEESTP